MMKKGIVLMATVILLAVVGVAAEVAFEVLTPEKTSERAYISASDSVYLSVSDPMYALLKSNYDGEVLWEATEKYANFKVTDKPTKEELVAIYNAMDNSKDIYAVIKVYRFWEMTNDDISIYTEIMNRYSTSIANSEYWFEDIYNELTNNVHGVLDVEEAREYIAAGISVDDIAVSNVLSRRGVYTITQILDLRKENKSWAYIADKLFSGYEYDAKHDEISAMTVIDAVYLAKRTDKTMSDYFDVAIEIGSLTMERQKYFTSATAGIKKMLKAENLWDYSAEEKENIQIRRQGILKIAEENGISPGNFAALESSGENESDILNASLIVKEKGVSVQRAIDEAKEKKEVVDR